MTDHLDVQGSMMVSSFILSRVGISGVKRPVTIRRPSRTLTLIPTFDVSVNLPADQKGSHMSRHIEVINKAIDMAVKEEKQSLEDLVEKIALELLRSHEYATYADVRLSTDYFLARTSPDRKQVTENYMLFAEARHKRGMKRPERFIGVEVSGMSACPCAMENVRELLKDELRSKGEPQDRIGLLDEIPVPTHNQKNRVYFEVGGRERLDIEADDLIDLVEGCFSSPTYEVLKRKGEALVVLNAHRRPRFVEDIVREIIEKFLERYPDLSDDMHLHIRSTSEESIHKHDAFAERVSTLGELRESTRFERKR